jgi:hypothetical protein
LAETVYAAAEADDGAIAGAARWEAEKDDIVVSKVSVEVGGDHVDLLSVEVKVRDDGEENTQR